VKDDIKIQSAWRSQTPTDFLKKRKQDKKRNVGGVSLCVHSSDNTSQLQIFTELATQHNENKVSRVLDSQKKTDDFVWKA
jgi:hypothetical protein